MLTQCTRTSPSICQSWGTGQLDHVEANSVVSISAEGKNRRAPLTGSKKSQCAVGKFRASISSKHTQAYFIQWGNSSGLRQSHLARRVKSPVPESSLPNEGLADSAGPSFVELALSHRQRWRPTAQSMAALGIDFQNAQKILCRGANAMSSDQSSSAHSEYSYQAKESTATEESDPSHLPISVNAAIVGILGFCLGLGAAIDISVGVRHFPLGLEVAVSSSHSLAAEIAQPAQPSIHSKPLLAFSVSLPWSAENFSPWGGVEEEVVPSKGTCSTCIGVVDDTLGSCESTANCVSSYDDRPVFFVAPWEYPTDLEAAVQALAETVAAKGGVIQEQSDRYIYATFEDRDSPTDDVEFLFSDPTEDRTVNIRAASRALSRQDRGRNAKRLEVLRNELQWEQVPILRNRERLFVVIESPWDTFGPEPPPTYDYDKGLDFMPNGD